MKRVSLICFVIVSLVVFCVALEGVNEVGREGVEELMQERDDLRQEMRQRVLSSINNSEGLDELRQRREYIESVLKEEIREEDQDMAEKIRLRESIKMRIREGIRDIKEDYLEDIKVLREIGRENASLVANEVVVMLNDVKNSNLTLEEKENLRRELIRIREQSLERKREYLDEAKKIRVQYKEELSDFLDEKKGKYRLSNGVDFEVKIMPEVASKKAIERLRLKVCNETNNCTIELKEIGREENARLVYSLKAQERKRFLGFLWSRDIEVESEVDADSGDVISSKKKRGFFYF
jgi:hypothetical protein